MHLNVGANLLFALTLRHPDLSDSVAQKRCEEVLERVELKGFFARDCLDLSGGERQRVALARTLLSEADYFLLDEPLSALDIELRQQMQQLLKRIHEERPLPTIIVTHDINEAEALGTKTLHWKGNSSCLEF